MVPGWMSTTFEVATRFFPLHLALTVNLYWPGRILILVQTIAFETESLAVPGSPSKQRQGYEVIRLVHIRNGPLNSSPA